MKTLLRTLLTALSVAMLLMLAACGGSSSSGSGSSGGSSASLNIAFLPKAINNPYFDTAANGAKQAATELKGQFKQVGPTESSAAAQVPFINTLTEQHVSAIVVSANDPNALAPALSPGGGQDYGEAG
ncbi:substrate-binding domain-containing protein [Thermogemmatispora tikiterensis]|uniref:Periplasmic binding protein domain-containing protein n=1 Tax=Thermogemmatispora tikiterensis TaxID=1825093 RepID=A0A328VFI0_9CHLR|nr:substrate-binding domain-containing protein [Thermogemmatispora tikiterensis]RAQ96568.1 hypothetical protein A4R35_13560 [Thermogemmatispora tikiterensis]